MKATVLLFALTATAASAQALQPGDWTLRSTAVDLTVPGVPGLLLRMARGKSKIEHKCVAPGGGIAALFVPDPKARCTVERAIFADGRIDYVMACPQKKGPPLRVTRTGTYGATGFTARMVMTGQAEKGAVRIVADQVATRAGTTCRKG